MQSPKRCKFPTNFFFGNNYYKLILGLVSVAREKEKINSYTYTEEAHL